MQGKPPIETLVPFEKAAMLARRAMRVEPTSVREKEEEELELLADGRAVLPHTVCRG